MKKRIIPFLFLVILCMSFTVPVCAANARLVDEADILTENEETSLIQTLDEISERLSFDIAVITKESIDGASAEDAAYQAYKEGGYGYGSDKDGALLLISMEERDWAITATGYGVTALNSEAKSVIGEKVSTKLSNGNYADAFSTFAKECDTFVSDAKEGKTYKEPFPFVQRFIIAFVVSLIIALIAVSSMKAELKSVSKQTAATAYVKKNSLKLTTSSERFLYRHLDKTEKTQNTSTSSSNHVAHTGSSGKF